MSLGLLTELPISNQCVVLCDLRLWIAPDSAAWWLLKGTQDEVGHGVAEALRNADVKRIDDFGGVAKSFLCDNEAYLESPRRTLPGAAIFSFTPKNKLQAEGIAMAQSAKAAGYELMILTLQKHDKFGKVWVLLGTLRAPTIEGLTYYEDTHAVVDELKAAPEGSRIRAVHVKTPEFAHENSQFADRVVSQSEYQLEVLAP